MSKDPQTMRKEVQAIPFMAAHVALEIIYQRLNPETVLKDTDTVPIIFTKKDFDSLISIIKIARSGQEDL